MHLRLKKGFSVISEGTEQQIKAKEKNKKNLSPLRFGYLTDVTIKRGKKHGNVQQEGHVCQSNRERSDTFELRNISHLKRREPRLRWPQEVSQEVNGPGHP